MVGTARNPLAELFDRYCSDKGTHWASRHHYASAYHVFLETRRVNTMIEVGIGEDTAPSIASWAVYFPDARIFALDITKKEDFDTRAALGVTDRLVARQEQGGCKHNRWVWSDRVRLNLDTDATSADDIAHAEIPSSAELIIDDGSHKMRDQEKTLALLWPRLSPGGVYIIEDVFVGALPWYPQHSNDAPTSNTDCRHECYYPQRIAEHPLLYDRFGVGGQKMSNRPALFNTTQAILRENDWFWTVTGVHQGGGLDCALVIRKSGADFAPPLSSRTFSPFGQAILLLAWFVANVFAVWGCSRRSNGYRLIRSA